ncbi:unnamed protein product, partial [Heterosigma akashiwo]
VVLQNNQAIPQVGLGTSVKRRWDRKGNDSSNKVQQAVIHAVRAGYTHFDCAFCYGSQEEVGEAIAEMIQNGEVGRADLFVVSKLWLTHMQPDDIEENLQQTLDQLQLDYLDLFLIHWPYALKKRDPYQIFPLKEGGGNGEMETEQVDLTATWAKMEELVDSGVIKSIGVSNFTKEQTASILESCRIRPVLNQVECHPFLSQEKLRVYLESENIKLAAHSPLGNKFPGLGLMESPMETEVIQSIAASKNKSAAQVILRWHIQKNHIVTPKSVTPSRIQENLDLFDFELSADEMDSIDALGSKNIRYCNPKFRPGGQLAYPNETSAYFCS